MEQLLFTIISFGTIFSILGLTIWLSERERKQHLKENLN